MENKELSYEQAFARLEEIVDGMSSASAPLDELMKLYEEGMGLVAHCEKLLKGYDAKLEMISQSVLQNELERSDAAFETANEDDEEAPF